MKTLEQRFWGKVDKTKTCWIWKSATYPFGHGVCRYKGIRHAHRAAWIIFNGVIPNGLCVLHKCDVPQCVNPDHLFLGTKRDNNFDRDIKGRQRAPLGEKSSFAKLTKEQVLEIRNSVGINIEVFSNKFHVSERCIEAVLTRQNWKHI